MNSLSTQLIEVNNLLLESDTYGVDIIQPSQELAEYVQEMHKF